MLSRIILKARKLRLNKSLFAQFSSVIEEKSFIHEYADDYYPNLNKNEFDLFLQESDVKIQGNATLKGTEIYSLRNKNNLEDHFNLNFQNNVLHSSLSMGTYRADINEKKDLSMYNAILDSFHSGSVNTFDTGHHWRYQKSERILGAALRKLRSEDVMREEVFLATRLGHIEEDYEKGVDNATRREQMIDQLGVNEEEIVANHCFNPTFLNDQLENSLNNLGVETLDLVYLNNPESLLNNYSFSHVADVLKTAFEFLEEKVKEGKIMNYGISSWAAFRAKHDSQFWMNLEDIYNIAKAVGGEQNSLNYLSLPINLAMPEAFIEDTQFQQGEATLPLVVAETYNINVLTSSPFMGGFLSQIPLSTHDMVSKHLHVKHLNLLRSLPYRAVKSVTVGHTTNRHVKINLGLGQIPRPTLESVERVLFTPRRRIIQQEPQMGVPRT